MKIDNSLKPVATGSNIAKATAPQTQTNSKVQKESVQISPLSAQLQAVGSGMSASPAINFNKVNQIKQAISEGRFQINPEAISEKLINSVKDLIQANQKNA